MDAITRLPDHVSPSVVFDFDIYNDPRLTEDVQGSYAEVIKDAPDIFWTPRNGGHWMVRRLEKITALQQDPEHFSVREMQIPRVPNPPFFIPLSLDPPANTPYRSILMPKFSPKAVREMEGKIREWAIRIIEDAAAKGRCEFVADVSSLFPVSIFMELMGMPLDRLREFRDLADAFFQTIDGAELERLSGEIQSIIRGLIQDRKVRPGEDLVSYLLTVDMEGRKLTDQEVEAIGFILFLGGMDTVTNVSSFMFQKLAAEPAIQQRLQDHPQDIAKFLDESLRCFAVVNTPRLVVADCERFGIHFKTGDMVLTLLPMAGRDDRVNDDPARFDMDREHASHLCFSTGPHLCIGHNLARMELKILLEEWTKRIPKFRAAPGQAHGFRAGTVMALLSLPLEWTPG